VGPVPCNIVLKRQSTVCFYFFLMPETPVTLRYTVSLQLLSLSLPPRLPLEILLVEISIKISIQRNFVVWLVSVAIESTRSSSIAKKLNIHKVTLRLAGMQLW